MSYLTLGLKGKKAIAILGETATIEEAGTIGDASTTPDYTVIAREKLGERSGPDLVAMFNALVPKEDAVERFATKDAGVNRLLAAWDAERAIPQKGDVPTTAVVSTEEAPAATTVSTTDEESQTMATKGKSKKSKRTPKAKKPAGERKGRSLGGTIHLTAKAHKEGKIWHAAPGKESNRFRVFQFLLKNDGIEREKALTRCMEQLKLSRSQVLGCITKLEEEIVGLIKVKAA